MIKKISGTILGIVVFFAASFLTSGAAQATEVNPSSGGEPNSAYSSSLKSKGDDAATTDGLWWPEVNVYVGCNDTFAASGAAWDLQGGAWYSVSWDYSYTTPGGGAGGSWDQNYQSLQASSTGFLTTSTHYGVTTNYSQYSATMHLYKDGQEVGQHTSTCYK